MAKGQLTRSDVSEILERGTFDESVGALEDEPDPAGRNGNTGS